MRNVELAGFACSVCGWPALSSLGMRIHYTSMHGKNTLGQRNWEICHYYSKGMSISRLAIEYHLSKPAIRRILHRALQYPLIYSPEV